MSQPEKLPHAPDLPALGLRPLHASDLPQIEKLDERFHRKDGPRRRKHNRSRSVVEREGAGREHRVQIGAFDGGHRAIAAGPEFNRSLESEVATGA